MGGAPEVRRHHAADGQRGVDKVLCRVLGPPALSHRLARRLRDQYHVDADSEAEHAHEGARADFSADSCRDHRHSGRVQEKSQGRHGRGSGQLHGDDQGGSGQSPAEKDRGGVRYLGTVEGQAPAVSRWSGELPEVWCNGRYGGGNPLLWLLRAFHHDDEVSKMMPCAPRPSSSEGVGLARRAADTDRAGAIAIDAAVAQPPVGRHHAEQSFGNSGKT
mmetsp:Transcript_2289/g.6752  ORF Transcript_2289/g.6752 Transcript_2289/m.6752 type:complete len:218 (-) Transcript_2289:13-666(-)